MSSCLDSPSSQLSSIDAARVFFVKFAVCSAANALPRYYPSQIIGEPPVASAEELKPSIKRWRSVASTISAELTGADRA